jgi:hypothetical protein
MKTTRCLEVYVRFHRPHLQGIRVMTADCRDTRAQHIRVQNDGHTLSLQFVDKDDDVLGELNYNFAEVQEYECKGWIGKRE